LGDTVVEKRRSRETDVLPAISALFVVPALDFVMLAVPEPVL
jgi:hypothetical protein